MGVVRKTQAVKLLLNEFENSSTAISTVNLVKQLSTKLNKSTIYRILEKLEDDGVLHSLMGKDGVKRYAKCKNCNKSEHIDNHPHFQCSVCGKISCLNQKISIPLVLEHKINSIQVLIEGECKKCLNLN